jgi:cytochrome c oxidase assembly protein subunit 19
MATPAKRQQVFAPMKGSFPIDHFKECTQYYENYMECLKSNNDNAGKCRIETREYME